MNALIHLVPGLPGAALFSIAGRPLVLRQLQWLRAVGCERIVLELPPGPDGVRVQAALDAESLGPGVEPIASSDLDPATLARSCGLAGRVLLLPADVIGDGDLVRLLLGPASDEVSAYFDPPPRCRRLGQASVQLLGTSPAGPQTPIRGPGWAVRLRNDDEAFLLTLVVLDGQLPVSNSSAWPVQVHASRIRSGVWVARGAEIHDTARLIRPVFIGPNAIIGRDAVVGPSVSVGEDALVCSLSKIRTSDVGAGASVQRSADVFDERVVAALRSPRPARPRIPAPLLAIALVSALTGASLVAVWRAGARPASSTLAPAPPGASLATSLQRAP